MAGQRGVEQAAQAVVQAELFGLAGRRGIAFSGVVAAVFAKQEWLALCIDGYAARLQGNEEIEARGVRRGGPAF
ncbi:hypothetical protein D3C81_2102230 [compost metagenome]